MDGKEIVRIIEAKLFELGISKGKFYKDCGLNSATMSNWRNGIFTPSPAKLHIIEEYLDVTFSDVSKNETTGMDANLAELLDSIRNRPDLDERFLCNIKCNRKCNRLNSVTFFIGKT